MSDQEKNTTESQEPAYKASSRYEYSYQSDDISHMLQIFSVKTMNSTFDSAQETLDLLHFLQKYEPEIKAAALQQEELAQQPKLKKSVDERLNDLFHR